MKILTLILLLSVSVVVSGCGNKQYICDMGNGKTFIAFRYIESENKICGTLGTGDIESDMYCFNKDNCERVIKQR